MNKEINKISRVLTALGIVGGGVAGNLDCATKPAAQVELTQIPTSTEALAKATKTIEWPTPTAIPTKTATPEPTSTPEPTPTKTPEVSLVEQAIKAGRIELKEENDWENYFIGVTSEEAKQLLEEANNGIADNNNLKDLLPFDPRQTPNLILADVEFDMPGGKSRVIGMKNIPAGTKFYSRSSGTADFDNGVAVGETLAIGFRVEKNDVNYSLIARREGTTTSIPPRVKIPDTKIGSPAFTLGSEGVLGIYPGEQQVILQTWWAGRQIYDNTLSKLLIKGCKIVFIDWQN